VLIPYPSEFPSEAFMLVLDKVRGHEVSPAELVHGAWVVAGYAASQTVGGGPQIGQEGPAAWSDEQVLEAVIQDSQVGQPGDPVGFGGTIALALVLKIAIKILLAAL
jgi:hypothetical protein